MKTSWLRVVTGVLTLMFSAAAPALAAQVFFTDFDSGVPVEFTGITTTEAVQGYSDNGFSGSFLRNTSGGPTAQPGSPTILTLTGLPAHTSIDLNFLWATIDSWDGGTAASGFPGGDIFTVLVDGSIVFQGSVAIQSGSPSYIPPPGVELTPTPRINEGFSSFADAGFNLGLDPTLDGIPHTSSTLVVSWSAAGPGWQGGVDESWAIDNVEVIVNADAAPVPEPATLTLVAAAMAVLGARARRRMRQR